MVYTLQTLKDKCEDPLKWARAHAAIGAIKATGTKHANITPNMGAGATYKEERVKITFVKKILADGSACKKCGEVTAKMEDAGQMKYIDETVIADERDPESAGLKLAAKYDVNRAPFFVVEEDGKDAVVYTVYFKFVKQVLAGKTSEQEEIKEIMNDNPDLDFI